MGTSSLFDLTFALGGVPARRKLSRDVHFSRVEPKSPPGKRSGNTRFDSRQRAS